MARSCARPSRSTPSGAERVSARSHVIAWRDSILRDERLTWRAKYTALALSTFMDASARGARPSLSRTLAPRMNLAVRTVRRGIRELEDAGYLVGTERAGRPTTYDALLAGVVPHVPTSNGLVAGDASKGGTSETHPSVEGSTSETDLRESDIPPDKGGTSQTETSVPGVPGVVPDGPTGGTSGTDDLALEVETPVPYLPEGDGRNENGEELTDFEQRALLARIRRGQVLATIDAAIEPLRADDDIPLATDEEPSQ
jgi:hypothetical protein